MNCNIIRDLLVPYLDNTCSDETKKLVDEHVGKCEKCRKELEKYKTELVVSIPETDKAVIKPFRKIKKRIILLVTALAVLSAVIIVCGSYIATGKSEGWYKADKSFFHIDDNNIYGGIQKSGIEKKVVDMYGRLYFSVIDKEKYYTQKASYDEIVQKCREIQSIYFDYDNMTVDDDSFFNIMSVCVPIIVDGDDVSMWASFTGTRTGIGKYYFSDLVIERDDMVKLGYSFAPDFVLMNNDLMLWPARKNYCNIKVNAFEKNTLSHASFYKEIPEYTDKRLEPGVYRYTSDEYYEEYTIYSDGTFTRKRKYDKEQDVRLIAQVNEISDPTRYFITKTSDGERFSVFSGMSLTSTIAGRNIIINDDGSFDIANFHYQKIS